MPEGTRVSLSYELVEQLLEEGESIGFSDVKLIIIALLAEVRRLRSQTKSPELRPLLNIDPNHPAIELDDSEDEQEENKLDFSSWK